MALVRSKVTVARVESLLLSLVLALKIRPEPTKVRAVERSQPIPKPWKLTAALCLELASTMCARRQRRWKGAKKAKVPASEPWGMVPGEGHGDCGFIAIAQRLTRKAGKTLKAHQRDFAAGGHSQAG